MPARGRAVNCVAAVELCGLFGRSTKQTLGRSRKFGASASKFGEPYTVNVSAR